MKKYNFYIVVSSILLGLSTSFIIYKICSPGVYMGLNLVVITIIIFTIGINISFYFYLVDTIKCIKKKKLITKKKNSYFILSFWGFLGCVIAIISNFILQDYIYLDPFIDVNVNRLFILIFLFLSIGINSVLIENLSFFINKRQDNITYDEK